jgi:hypothetical protein
MRTATHWLRPTAETRSAASVTNTVLTHYAHPTSTVRPHTNCHVITTEGLTVRYWVREPAWMRTVTHWLRPMADSETLSADANIVSTHYATHHQHRETTHTLSYHHYRGAHSKGVGQRARMDENGHLLAAALADSETLSADANIVSTHYARPTSTVRPHTNCHVITTEGLTVRYWVRSHVDENGHSLAGRGAKCCHQYCVDSLRTPHQHRQTTHTHTFILLL